MLSTINELNINNLNHHLSIPIICYLRWVW